MLLHRFLRVQYAQPLPLLPFIAYAHNFTMPTFSGQTVTRNLSKLLLSHRLRFRFKTRGDVKLNYMCHNILRSSKPTCGPSFRYRLSWSARRESKQADFHTETAKEGSTGFTRDLSDPR